MKRNHSDQLLEKWVEEANKKKKKKEINPEIEAPILSPFRPLMPTADSLEKTLILGKIEGRRNG